MGKARLSIMKIKVAICTTDTQYSERLVHYFQEHYYDKFTWNIFTDITYLLDFCGQKDVDIVLLGEEMAREAETFSIGAGKNSVWAYLAADMEAEETGVEVQRIVKYCRADKLYRSLLELYSQKENVHYQSGTIADSKTDIYAFVSAAGGVGTSTIACAMAQSYAKFEKVLYINLENIGAPHLVFAEDDKDGLEEVIFALKSRRRALELKIASSVSRDQSGVYFLGGSRNALDVMELTWNDLRELLTALRQMKEYDKVILDIGTGMGEKEIAAMTCAGRVIVVTGDSEVCRIKFERYISALQSVEEQRKADICSKMLLVYNKVPRTEQLPEQQCQVRVAGCFPRIENGDYSGIVGRIAGMEMIHNMR